MKWQQYDRARAIFQPQRTDDLKPGAVEWIGREAEWTASWVIEEEDGGPYVGEIAWSIDPYLGAPFAWVPTPDLVFLDEEPI